MFPTAHTIFYSVLRTSIVIMRLSSKKGDIIPEKLFTCQQKYSIKWFILAIYTNTLSYLKSYFGGSKSADGSRIADINRGSKSAAKWPIHIHRVRRRIHISHAVNTSSQLGLM